MQDKINFKEIFTALSSLSIMCFYLMSIINLLDKYIELNLFNKIFFSFLAIASSLGVVIISGYIIDLAINSDKKEAKVTSKQNE